VDHDTVRKFHHPGRPEHLRRPAGRSLHVAMHARPDAKQARHGEQRQPGPRGEEHVGPDRWPRAKPSHREIDDHGRDEQDQAADQVVEK